MTAHSQQQEQPQQKLMWVLGIAFTFLIAALGYLLAMVPGFDHVGQ